MHAPTRARRQSAARATTVKSTTTVLAAVVALGASVLVTATGSTAAHAATVSQRPVVTGHALSGMVSSGGITGANTFAAWRGRPVEVIVNYLGTSTWTSITGVARQGLTGYWAGSNAHRVWSVPMLPLQEPASLTAEASGAYNSKFFSVAQQLVAGGDGSSTIRLGWEMTGDWYTWSGQKNPSAFAEAWRQVVRTMRSVPGAHFTFDFNIAMGNTDPALLYPGDGYVDFIGADNYDTSWAWSYAPSDHVQVWQNIRTRPYGLDWLAAFASAHGKRMAFDEWGVSKTCSGHGGGDDPYFVQQFMTWMAQHDVAWDAYFERDYTSCESHLLTGGNFPNAAAAYRAAVQSTRADDVHLGFETNNLSGWSESHPSGQSWSVGVDTAKPHTGGSKLWFRNAGDFEQAVHMDRGAATTPGTYRVSAWFRLQSGTGVNGVPGVKPTTARLEVTHADGSSPTYTNLWLTNAWTYVSTTVASPAAGLTAGFHLKAHGGTSLEVDDVVLQRI